MIDIPQSKIDPQRGDYLEKYRLPGDYWLMIPSWYGLDDNQIVLYDVVEMLKLQQADKTLTGHPSKDLPPEAWGTVRFSASKAARWVERGRLLKIRMKDHIRPVTGGTETLTYSIRYSEPAEWQAVLTPEEWNWIVSVCQVSELYKQMEAEPEAITPEPPQKPKQTRRQRLKAKERRRLLRREQIETGYEPQRGDYLRR